MSGVAWQTRNMISLPWSTIFCEVMADMFRSLTSYYTSNCFWNMVKFSILLVISHHKLSVRGLLDDFEQMCVVTIYCNLHRTHKKRAWGLARILTSSSINIPSLSGSCAWVYYQSKILESFLINQVKCVTFILVRLCTTPMLCTTPVEITQSSSWNCNISCFVWYVSWEECNMI